MAQAHDALVEELDAFALVRAQHRRQVRIDDDVDHALGPAVMLQPRLAVGEPTPSPRTVASPLTHVLASVSTGHLGVRAAHDHSVGRGWVVPWRPHGLGVDLAFG